MKKIAYLTALFMAVAMQSCNAQSGDAGEERRPSLATQSSPLVRVADFTDVAAATIDGVVHIKTEMTQLTPLYQSFFGFIIQQGVHRQVYTASGSGVIVTSDG